MMFKLWKREWAVIIGVFIVLGFVLWVFSGCVNENITASSNSYNLNYLESHDRKVVEAYIDMNF